MQILADNPLPSPQVNIDCKTDEHDHASISSQTFNSELTSTSAPTIPPDAPGARNALLGSNYGNSRRSEFSPSNSDPAAKKSESQVKRFYLQSIARRLIDRAEPRHGKISKRTCGCLRRRIDKDQPVGVLYVAATASAHYGNLQA